MVETAENKAFTDYKKNVKSKDKKYVRYAEGAELYSVSLSKFQEIAKSANAIRKINQLVLVNLEKVDAFIESCEVPEEFYK